MIRITQSEVASLQSAVKSRYSTPREVFFVPHASRKEIEFLLSRYYLFKELARELGLPEPGFEFQSASINPSEYPGIPMALNLSRKSRLGSVAKAIGWNWKWISLPDEPVHDRNNRFYDEDIRNRIMRNNIKKIKEFLREFGTDKRFRVVIHGADAEEYAFYWNVLSKEVPVELLNEVVGVGSVCTRKRGELGVVHRLVTDNPTGRPLHIFGLNADAVKSLRGRKWFHGFTTNAGYVFRWEIRDIKKKYGLNWDDRRLDYLLAHLIQYVRSSDPYRRYDAVVSLF